MFVKILWLFVTFSTICAIIESSALKEVDVGEEYEKLKAGVETGKIRLNVKRYANGKTEDTSETKTEQTPKLHRVPLTRIQPVRFQHYQTENENTKQRSSRGVDEYKDTKKSQRKLKLNRTDYKSGKAKNDLYESGSDKYAEGEKSRRYIDVTDNYRMKRYVVSENLTNDRTNYYAQRKAVMDRFHARQKEISEKYSKSTTTTTPKYVKYDSGMTLKPPTVRNETNNVDEQEDIVVHFDNDQTVRTLEFIRRDMGTRKNKDASSFGRKGANSIDTGKTMNDYNDLNAYRRKSIKKVNPKMKTNNDIQLRQFESEENSEEDTDENDDNTFTDDSSNTNSYVSPNNINGKSLSEVYSKSGKCWKLVYQHNFIIGVHEASQADADILTSIEGSFCITCVKIEPLKKSKAKIQLNTTRKGDTFSEMKLHIEGFENEELSYVVKVYAVEKVNGYCDHYY